jgi:macrolide-specific efflux system membrane fusion protein
MKRTWLIVGILSLAGALGAAYGFGWLGRSELGRPKVGKVVESIYGLGTVTADQIYRAKTGVSVQIRDLSVTEGDQVKANDLIARLEESVIRAPFSGTITEVSFKAGEIVPPQTPIFTLTNLARLYLEVNLEQQSILRVKPSLPAQVSFESLRSENVTGKVKAVYPRGAQFIVRIELDRWPEGVLPGMTADVAIKVGEKDSALLIPLNAISGGKVTRVRGGRHEKVDVKLGVVDNLWAELVSGDITSGDELVLRGR